MKKVFKIVITVILIALVIFPLGYFVIYPNYNKVIGPIKRFDIQRSAKELTFQLLTELVPTKDRVLGVAIQSPNHTSIEESIGKPIRNHIKRYE